MIHHYTNTSVFNMKGIYTLNTSLQKCGNALEKWGFGQYQHKSLYFFGANTLK